MDALIIMTRIPIPGKTKTRLMNVFTGEECAELHRCFLRDIFNMFEIIKDDIEIFLTYTPEDSFDVIKEIVPGNIKTFPQQGEKLGERMMNSIDLVLTKGYSKVILIGADIPNIQPHDIKEAFETLDNSDVVLGPTFDGGYYLVGMKKLYGEVFNDNLKWGNKSVFEGTLDIANRLSLKTGLAKKYRDIDTRDDLISFVEHLSAQEQNFRVFPGNTMNFIKKCWSGFDNVKRRVKG
jgi:uncharacterized protein